MRADAGGGGGGAHAFSEKCVKIRRCPPSCSCLLPSLSLSLWWYEIKSNGIPDNPYFVLLLRARSFSLLPPSLNLTSSGKGRKREGQRRRRRRRQHSQAITFCSLSLSLSLSLFPLQRPRRRRQPSFSFAAKRKTKGRTASVTLRDIVRWAHRDTLCESEEPSALLPVRHLSSFLSGTERVAELQYIRAASRPIYRPTAPALLPKAFAYKDGRSDFAGIRSRPRSRSMEHVCFVARCN